MPLRHRADVDAADWTSVALRGNPSRVAGVPAGMRATVPSVPLALLATALVVAGCAAPAPVPSGGSGAPSSAEPPPAEPVVATGTSDGVGVTLVVDRARVAAGGDVTANVSVRNLEPGVVTWQGGGCDLQGQFTVTPTALLPAAPAGRVWDGDRDVIQQLALPDAYAIRSPVPPQLAHVDVAFGCTSDLRINELKPGEQAQASAVWVASTMAGSPVPAGDYVVAVSFPFIGRDLADPLKNFDITTSVKPITAQIVVSVEDHPAVAPASLAMDAILGDPALAAWQTRHPRERWSSTAIRYVDGAWVVRIRYEPDRMLSARQDPATGAVTLSEGPAPTPQP